MPQSFASLHVHFVFSTKKREPFIGADWEEGLYAYIGGILRGHKGCLIAAGGIPDHIHLLASLPRDLSIAEVMQLVKGNSSGWVHETFPALAAFAGQAGYGAFAVSYSNLEQVKQYIANQKEHHKKRTFQDEFRALLRLHAIEWDERYVWD